MPVFERHGFVPEWRSLGSHWDTALPWGTGLRFEYDLRDISDFARWRQGRSDGISYARPDLTDGEVQGVIGHLEDLLLNDPPDVVCLWSNSTFQNRAATVVCRRAGIPIFYFEGAFFGSPRTGRHMHIIDPIGCYFQGESWLRQAWDDFLVDQPLTDEESAAVKKFVRGWSTGKCSKYHQGDSQMLPAVPAGKKMLFVPLQTPHDGTMWWPECVVRSPEDLVRLIVEHAGDQWYPVFKKHPKDRTHIDRYRCPGDGYALIDGGHVHDLIEASAGVALINSTVGIEALTKGRRVLTLGESFYSGDGWTEDVRHESELPAALDRLSASPRIVGDQMETFQRYLNWVVFTYLADPTEPHLELRYLEALRWAQVQQQEQGAIE